MRKRPRKDILEKAAPDLFGSKQVDVHTNYMAFPVPAVVHKKILEWVKNGDRLIIGGINQDKELRIVVINEREQRLYEARGCRDN